MRLVQHESTIIKKSKQKKSTDEKGNNNNETKTNDSKLSQVYYCSAFTKTGATPDNENLNQMVKLI